MAYQEEKKIAGTLRDLLRQDVWQASGHSGEIWVVVNGSTDATAARAREVLAESGVAHEVVELARPGKANAWNVWVHEKSPKTAEVLMLADADIQLPETGVLRGLLETLEAHPAAVAAVDEPVKDVVFTAEGGGLGRMSGLVSEVAKAGPPKLCGQLYAARAGALRKMYLPEPLLVEDGLIKAMLVTDNFTQAEDVNRLVRAAGCFHVYEAERKFSAIYRHEKRILIGSLCNFLLFARLREVAAAGEEPGAWLKAKVMEDGEWFRGLIRKELRGRFLWVSMLKQVVGPFRQLRHFRGAGWLKAFPAVAARSLFQAAVAVGAGLDLKRGRLAW